MIYCVDANKSVSFFIKIGGRFIISISFASSPLGKCHWKWTTRIKVQKSGRVTKTREILFGTIMRTDFDTTACSTKILLKCKTQSPCTATTVTPFYFHHTVHEHHQHPVFQSIVERLLWNPISLLTSRWGTQRREKREGDISAYIKVIILVTVTTSYKLAVKTALLKYQGRPKSEIGDIRKTNRISDEMWTWYIGVEAIVKTYPVEESDKLRFLKV